MIEPLPPGRARTIGPYQLLGLLGAGGMGEVYLARPAGAADPFAGLVALKTVRPDLDLDDGFRIRFRREIDAAGAVSSPRTAALVGGDAGGAQPWLATEYVPGPSLAEAVTRVGPMPEHVVRETGAGLARALADMHAVRVLHRDLKPGNVLLGADGPKVIDFGIAQAFDATQLTRTGVVVGSPGYISPEHVNGSRALVPASDVFCLGAVLAFAAAGRGPFDDSDMAAVIFRIARGEAELSGVPPRLRGVIEACLRTGAADRPTPRELADLLLPGRGAAVTAPGAFPWTDGVRGLLDEHAAGAQAAARASAPFVAPAHDATVLDAPARHPATLVAPPGGPVAAPGGGRRALRIGVAAVAVAVCAALGTVLLPGLLDGGDGNGNGDGGGAGGSGAARTGTVVVPGADAGRTGDFGTAATELAARPAGWKAWRTEIEGGPAPCVLADATLVCGGPRRVTALDAADGRKRWEGEPVGEEAGPVAVAAATGSTVYAFEDGALVARGLTDGTERWREPLPEGGPVTDSVESGGVLYYATASDGTGPAHVFARRLTGAHGLVWDEEWDDPAAGAALAFADGRLVAAGDGVTVFRGGDGSRLGDIEAGEVTCLRPVLKGSLLLCSGPDGLTVVDATDPGNRRSVAAGVDVAHPPAVSDDGKVVVSSGTRTYAFGLSDGRQYWATYEDAGTPDLNITGTPVLAGSKALVVGERKVLSVDMAAEGEPDVVGEPPTGWPLPDRSGNGPDPALTSFVARGNVMFVSFEDGTVLSAFMP
ncbi:protein kinase [Streptomyces sp. NPDC056061]|uniref:serine/threonine-protein kinase n=1 Tax=Streptomyces sp. NPDC056061 TaxID=3345700 RepID=UPI0035E187AE